MASDESGVDKNSIISVRGRVGEISKILQTQGDENLAQQLQDEEFTRKKGFNRNERRTARIDVPLAKRQQLTEDEQSQKEKFEFLERQKQIADEDKRIALELQKEEEQRQRRAADAARNAEQDARLARRLQEEEASEERVESDSEIARRFQMEEQRIKRQQNLLREMKDEELARRLQEQDDRLFQMRKSERHLREQRHRLQQQLLDDNEQDEVPPPLPQKVTVGIERRQSTTAAKERRAPGSSVRNTTAILNEIGSYEMSQDGRISERERLELLQLQDEEIARALQENEKQKVRSKSSDLRKKDIRKELEERDAELARILQEQERLEVQKEKEIQRIEEQLAQSRNIIEPDEYSVCPVPHVESVNNGRPTRSRVGSVENRSSARSHVQSIDDRGPVRSPKSPAATSNLNSANQMPVYSAVSRNPPRPTRTEDQTEVTSSRVVPPPVTRSNSDFPEYSQPIRNKNRMQPTHSNSVDSNPSVYQNLQDIADNMEDDPSTIYQNARQHQQPRSHTSCKQHFTDHFYHFCCIICCSISCG